MSIRRVVWEMGVGRHTVRKYLGESQPRRRELKLRRRPVWTSVMERIERLLNGWRGRTTAPQRISGRRVHRQLSGS